LVTQYPSVTQYRSAKGYPSVSVSPSVTQYRSAKDYPSVSVNQTATQSAIHYRLGSALELVWGRRPA
jgi:hypothetical protein